MFQNRVRTGFQSADLCTSAATTVADPGTAGAYTNEVDAVVLLNARTDSAAVMVATQLPGVFSGQLQASGIGRSSLWLSVDFRFAIFHSSRLASK